MTASVDHVDSAVLVAGVVGGDPLVVRRLRSRALPLLAHRALQQRILRNLTFSDKHSAGVADDVGALAAGRDGHARPIKLLLQNLILRVVVRYLLLLLVLFVPRAGTIGCLDEVEIRNLCILPSTFGISCCLCIPSNVFRGKLPLHVGLLLLIHVNKHAKVLLELRQVLRLLAEHLLLVGGPLVVVVSAVGEAGVVLSYRVEGSLLLLVKHGGLGRKILQIPQLLLIDRWRLERDGARRILRRRLVTRLDHVARWQVGQRRAVHSVFCELLRAIEIH